MLRRSFNALLLSLPLLTAAPAFAQEKPKVVTTFTIIADIAANVAGDSWASPEKMGASGIAASMPSTAETYYLLALFAALVCPAAQ